MKYENSIIRKPEITFILLLLGFMAATGCAREKLYRGYDYGSNGLVGEERIEVASPSEEYYRFKYSLLGEVERVDLIKNDVPYEKPGEWTSALHERTDKGVAVHLKTRNGLPFNQNGYVSYLIEEQAENNGTISLVDNNGFKTRERYEGYAGIAFKGDDSGRLTERRLVNRDGSLFVHPGGRYAIVKSAYDEAGNEIETAFFDTEGEPVNHVQRKYHRKTSEYNKAGLETAEKFFDSEGKPVMDSTGCHLNKIQYGDNGQPTEITCLDAENKPATFKNAGKKGIHKFVTKYDPARRLVEGRVYDVKGELINDRNTRAITRHTYDEAGFRVKTEYFDAEEKPMAPEGDFHRVTLSYRPGTWQVTGMSYFDTEGEPTGYPGKVHRMENTYNEAGLLIEEKFLDSEGKPVVHPRSKHHRRVMAYDPRGYQTEVSFFDAKNEPSVADGKWHKIKVVVDERGNLSDKRVFDVKGEPARHKEGFHRGTYVRDPANETITMTFFDGEGKPVKHDDIDCHKVVKKLDEFGASLSEKCYDEKDAVVNYDKLRMHEVRLSYLPSGLLGSIAFFDRKGEPIGRGGDNVHLIKREYHPFGWRWKASYFNTKEKKMNAGIGAHQEIWEYDETGKMYQYTSLRANGSRQYRFNY